MLWDGVSLFWTGAARAVILGCCCCCCLSWVRCWCWCRFVAECSSSPTTPTATTSPPHPTPHLSSQQLQQQWANRCLRECPLRWPSCQNHPQPWRPLRQHFPGRLHSSYLYPVSPLPPLSSFVNRGRYAVMYSVLWNGAANKYKTTTTKRRKLQKEKKSERGGKKQQSKCHTTLKHF